MTKIRDAKMITVEITNTFSKTLRKIPLTSKQMTPKYEEIS